MGNWTIVIEGHGIHHSHQNPTGNDANKLAAAFVRELRAAGHDVTHASFTHGGCDLLDSEVAERSWQQSEDYYARARSLPADHKPRTF